MLGRIAKLLGFRQPDPPSLILLRTFSEELAAAAGELRQVAQRVGLLTKRVEWLELEANAWQQRLERVRALDDEDLMVGAAKMSGRVEGQLEAAREELSDMVEAETELRAALVKERRRWARLVDQGQGLGLDLTGCLLHVDLTVPPPPEDPELGEDEDREFLARVIDGIRVH